MNLDSKKIARLVPIDTFFGNGSFFIDSKNRLWLSYNNRIFLTDLQHTDQYIEFKPNEKGLKSSIITQMTDYFYMRKRKNNSRITIAITVASQVTTVMR